MLSQHSSSHLRFIPSEKTTSDAGFTYEVIPTTEATGVHFRTSIDSGSYIAPHWHHAVEIIYLLEGSLTVSSESSTHEYHEGDCILINADVIHSTKCTAPNKAILFQIPLDFMTVYIPDAHELVFTLDNETDKAV